MFPAKLFQHLAPRAQNPRWPPDLVGGMANFFPMAPRVKILVATIWFSCILAEFGDFLYFLQFLSIFH